MAARGIRVLSSSVESISHERSKRTSEIISAQEDEICISARPFNVLFIS